MNRRSRMAFLAGAIGRAVVTGLAFYGARRLYQEYMSQSQNDNDVTNSNNEESIWSPDLDDVEPNFTLTIDQRLQTYYYENVSIYDDGQLYQNQLEILNEVCNTIHGLLAQSLPRFHFNKMEVKTYDCLGTTGSGENYTVYLPITLDSNLWEILSGNETILPEADGFYLVKRINQQFFKQGLDALDGFLIGGYVSSGKLFTFLREKFLLIDTDKERRFGLSARVSQQIEFEIETENDQFTFSLQIVVRVHRGPEVLATNMEENMWTKCYFSAENAGLCDLQSQEIQCLKCLIHCAKNDAILYQLPKSVFVSVVLSLAHGSSNPSLFRICLRVICSALKCADLPQFFNPNVNIIRHMKDRDCDRIAAYLDELSEKEFEPLFTI